VCRRRSGRVRGAGWGTAKAKRRSKAALQQKPFPRRENAELAKAIILVASRESRIVATYCTHTQQQRLRERAVTSNGLTERGGVARAIPATGGWGAMGKKNGGGLGRGLKRACTMHAARPSVSISQRESGARIWRRHLRR
jgi:hypothetical protein